MIVDSYGQPYKIAHAADTSNRRGPQFAVRNDDIDRLIPSGDRKTLTSLSNRLFMNMGVPRACILQKADYSVGEAWIPSYLGKDKEKGKMVAKFMHDIWLPQADIRGGVFDWWKLLELTSVEIDRAGDAFWLMVKGSDGFPRIQMIPNHRCYSSYENTVKDGNYSGYRIQDGVIYYSSGQPAAYRFNVGKDGKEREAYKPRLTISTPEERAERSGPGLYDAAERRKAELDDDAAEIEATRERSPHAPVAVKKEGLSDEAKAQIAESVDAAFAKSGPLHPVTLLPSEAPAVPAPSEAPSKGAPAIMASGRDDHNTPPEILEVVREFGGGTIDLDPCHNEHSRVNARVALTRGGDGLGADWVALLGGKGLVFVNPPYDQEALSRLNQSAGEQGVGGVEVVTLPPVKSDQAWFQLAIAVDAAAVCFVSGRVRFWADGARQQGAAFESCLFYYGERASRFCEVFGQLGVCLDLTKNRGQ